MDISGIVLAAGLSSRMKAFKPLLTFNEKTIIECSLESMLRAGVKQVVMVLGYRGTEIEMLLRDQYNCSQLVFIHNHRFAETDMLTSVKIGISALKSCEAFYLLPGDMPAIHPTTFLAVKEAMIREQALVAFPTLDGYRKHPPLISWKCREAILRFDKEGGLREMWKQLESQIITVPVEDIGCMLDADTPGDYNKLVDYMKSWISS